MRNTLGGELFATLLDNYLEPYRKFGTLKGRATRTEYWVFTLANTLFVWVLMGIDSILGVYSEGDGIGLLSGIALLCLAIPGIAVEVRRLHDSNLSGGWFFISLVPVVGWIVNLIQMVRPSTSGPNRFGDQPGVEATVVESPA